MTLIGWIVVGFVAGGLARFVTRAKKRGCVGTVVVGVTGAFIGGFLFSAFEQKGIDEFSLWSIFVAFVGSCLLLWVLEALAGRRG